jgi:hypothetical protein
MGIRFYYDHTFLPLLFRLGHTCLWRHQAITHKMIISVYLLFIEIVTLPK